MYPIFTEQQQQPQFSLNGYIQLEALLYQEQQHRLLQEYKKKQEQKRRIEKAMSKKLQAMKELCRRREQEQCAIQAYYAAKTKEEEQRRQHYYAALQQRQQYLLALAHQQQEVMTSEEKNHQNQLASLVKLIFGAHQEEDTAKGEQEQVTHVVEAEAEQESIAAAEQLLQQTMSVDEFVNYISKKARSLDSDGEEEEGDNTTALAIQRNGSANKEAQIPSLVDSQGPVNAKDPVKIAKYDALSRIEQELNEIRQRHEDHVLHVTLDFSSPAAAAAASSLNNNVAGADNDTLITATTAENREFLGYEDQIMKILLKLDMIDSDGDTSIRNERKTLVKRAEEMLGKLDDFKQREWERVSCSSNQSSEDEEM